MKLADEGADDSLLVDISDALSERDRVRFTVHTRTKLPQFAKQVMSVVRQHEEFIWLHDCLEDNDQYAGYIIPPPPPKPDFDASREKLQRLGDSEANMTKEEFAKMKQELEAEYLAIFKKTVAMHEIFLQRLAAHEKFRQDNNFKVFLEYENELAVRCKSKKERLAGSIQNIGKSFTDFVITTSQVAATTSASAAILVNPSTLRKPAISGSAQNQKLNGNTSTSDISSGSGGENSSRVDSSSNHSNAHVTSTTLASPETTTTNSSSSDQQQQQDGDLSTNTGDGNNNQQERAIASNSVSSDDDIDEQYFEKERLFLALYHSSIRDAANQADKVTQIQKCVADSYLYISQQLVKLASIEVVPITAQTEDSSNFVASQMPSNTKTLACANDHTSEGLKQFLLHFSDYLEQARKIETRMASDEDLKLTDTFLYYKRDTVAAQDLLMRRLRFMSEYETATKNLEKARQKGGTQMQYADVIQKQAKENFISISKLSKKELIDYKQRRVASFRKAFNDLVELELKHLRAHSQLITNCLNTCRGIKINPVP